MVTATASELAPRVRWSWLWGQRSDLAWNLAPFWFGTLVGVVVLLARHLGSSDDNPVLNPTFAGHPLHLVPLAMLVYGPLVDAPHLFATVARTYADADEWKARRRLFLGSLAVFLVGPLMIALPYLLGRLGILAGQEEIGFLVWSQGFTFYALYHVNKQHWGFVSLYKRKNGDSADPVENRIDQWFFHTAIWLPYVAMLTASWYAEADGKPLPFLSTPFLGTTLGNVLHVFCHVAFLSACVSYAVYQFSRYRAGLPRNGPKLVYLATILSLYYLTFTLHPLLAALWVMVTGVGHCVQYHRVVWAYGQSKYVGKRGSERKVPSEIFERAWLYALLGVAFGFFALQGPGAGTVKRFTAALFASHVVSWLGTAAGVALGMKVAAAFISGVRIHHFYVDGKIWKVSKSAALAKNLDV